MAKEYNFDAVMAACSSGSYLSNSLDDLQDDIEKLQRLIKELEEAYHGIGYKSSIYKMYDALYNNIGSASNYNYWNNSGVWSSIQNIVYKTDNFILQIHLYLASVIMLVLSKLNLPVYDYELYTMLSLIHMSALPYYTSIKGEISTDNYI